MELFIVQLNEEVQKRSGTLLMAYLGGRAKAEIAPYRALTDNLIEVIHSYIF